MNFYFFDLDDTICDTTATVNDFLSENNIPAEKINDEIVNKQVEEYLRNYGHEKIQPLNNSIFLLLRQLIATQKENVYYITARTGDVREQSKFWLKKYDLYLGSEKLIMDSEGKKGFIINNLLEQHNKQFAFFFDDLADNHKEASKYTKIISCVPY